jgi:hypothetical protein
VPGSCRSASRSTVLVLAGLEVAAGVDEQHLVVGLVLAEDQHGGGDAGAVEQLGRQADHGIEQVLLDQLLADAPLGRATEQHAMRHDDRHAAGARASWSRSCAG